MKRIWYIVLLCIFSCRAHDEELFLQASDAYNKQEFDRALQLYQAMTKKGPGAWYNIGNCFYCLGQNISALGAWTHAYQTGFAPVMKLSLSQIAHVHPHVICQQKSIFTYAPILMRFLQCPIFVWQVLLLVLWYSIVYLIFQRKKKWLLVGILSTCALLLGGLLWLWYTQGTTRWAITQEGVLMKAGPGNHCTQKNMIPRAAVVRWSDQEADWTKVAYETTSGWIPSDILLKV